MTDETAQAAEQQETNHNDSIEKATAALTAKNSQLIAEKRKLAEDLRRFEGVDPEEFKTLKSERERLEDEKLVAEKNFDELYKRKSQKAIEEQMKLAAAEKERADSLDARAKNWEARVLENEIFKAGSGKIHDDKGAHETLAMMAKNIFSFDEKGNVVQFDQDGQIVLGRDGKTPYSPNEWIDSLRETHKFLFPAGNTGGGATGSRQVSGGRTMTTEQFYNAYLPRDRGAALQSGKVTLID
jgi:hypothetical protein